MQNGKRSPSLRGWIGISFSLSPIPRAKSFTRRRSPLDFGIAGDGARFAVLARSW